MMNKAPMTEKPSPAPTHRPPVRDLSHCLLPILLLILFVALTLFFVWIGQRTASANPSVDPPTTTVPPTETEEHIAVTYPSSPSRESYLLVGNGAAIDGTKLSASSIPQETARS